jgi:acyl dehydratase
VEKNLGDVSMVEKVDLVWENLDVGAEIPPSYVVVTPQLMKRYAYAVDDWDLESIPVRDSSIGQALLLGQALLNAYRAKYRVDRVVSGLHARSEVEILNPPKLWERVTITARHSDRYEKRGHRYRVLEAEARGEDGVMYLRARNHETLAASVGAAKGAPNRETAEKVPTIVSDILVPNCYKEIPLGAQVTPICKQVTFEQMIAFTGMAYDLSAGEKTYHTDIEFARSFGLPTAIAQGQMSACYVSELMTRFFGWGWRRGGRMLVKFINAVFAGDTLYVTGTVKQKAPEGDATRIILDVWCENQAGEKVTVGEASGLMR